MEPASFRGVSLCLVGTGQAYSNSEMNMPTARKNNPVKSSSQGSTKTLEDLFHDTLQDIYYAEKKILKALPKMAEGRNRKN